MNAAKLMEELIQLSTEKTEDTVDICKAGDPNRELHKVALCCTATPDIIRQENRSGGRNCPESGASVLCENDALYRI